MGFESANYQIRYEEQASAAAVRAARVLGGEFASHGGDSTDLIIRDLDYWIDVKVWHEIPVVSVRVAYTNPPHVLGMLRSAIAALLAAAEATVIDLESDTRFTNVAPDSWRLLSDSYERGRDAFKAKFGDFDAPVSADRVFEILQQRDGGAD